MKTKWFWMMCMIVMTSLVAVSCGDDDDENTSGNTPEGAITVNLVKGESFYFVGGQVKWDYSTNNIQTYSGGSDYELKIVSLGEKSGLGSINTNKIPESGWAYLMACKSKYAYIVKAENRQNKDDNCYLGIYVVRSITSTSGGIMGAEVQYCKFTPGKGWNQ